MRGLSSWDRTHIVTLGPSSFATAIVEGVYALIGAICLLLRQERAKTAVSIRATRPSITSSCARCTIVWIEGGALSIIVILGLIVCTCCQVIYWVEVANVTSHADVLSANVKQTQLSQVIDQQVSQSNALSRLLQCIFMAVDLRQYRTELHL